MPAENGVLGALTISACLRREPHLGDTVKRSIYAERPATWRPLIDNCTTGTSASGNM